MYLTAPEPLGLSVQPGQERPCVSLLAGCWQRGEIVDVEMVTPGEVVSDAEASHGERRRRIVGYGADQAVTGRPLSLVDLPDELILGGKPGPQPRIASKARSVCGGATRRSRRAIMPARPSTSGFAAVRARPDDRAHSAKRSHLMSSTSTQNDTS